MAQKFLSRSDAARESRRCRKTLRAYAQRGEGPQHVVLAGRALYPENELREWIAQHGFGGAR